MNTQNMKAWWRIEGDTATVSVGHVPVLEIDFRRREGRLRNAAHVYSSETARSRARYGGYEGLPPVKLLELVNLLGSFDLTQAVRAKLIELGWPVDDNG
ncbi:MAG: hypothetical protein KKA73_03365 [Chloroflexi bacterium]|nr:hypothetical protein [Chloroflexota bacterium]MBU1746703.1 hypothetical protein [Chloroflexota bacterium]